LGDVVSKDCDVENAMIARMHAGWRKFRDLSGVLCGKTLSFKLEEMLYKACIHNVLCYGAECWAIKKVDIRRMQSTEMRMIWMMCGRTLRDLIPNVTLRKKNEIEDIKEHLEVHWLRWFGHLERMNSGNIVKRIWKKEIDGRKRKGRLHKTWNDEVREDMTKMGLSLKNAGDRARCRRG